MNLSLTDDQSAILDALDSLTRPYAAMPSDCRSFVLTSPALDRELAEGGFLDVGYDPDLGATTAALVTERLARLPYATEVAASALVRPLLGEAAGPTCLVDAAALERPVRFLAAGATVVVLEGARVTSFTATAEDVAPVDSLYAYPVALLARDLPEDRLTTDVTGAELRARWRVALAAEAAGLMAAALASTVLYVSERKQFGRPLGTFQALRHRLAEAQVRTTGVYWLAMRAAASGDGGDAALAALHAQESATQVVYDLHQFLAGMGVTLEHPLHLWTYRLKALLPDLGGGLAQGVDAAALIWNAA